MWKKAEAEIKLLLLMQNLLTIRKARHGLSIQGDTIRETGAFRSTGKKYIGFLGELQINLLNFINLIKIWSF